MIEGIFLGIVSWLSLVMSWYHLPQAFKDWTLRHPVLSDLTAGAFIYFVLSSVSKSLVAAVGAVFAGLLVNFSLFTGKKIKENASFSRDDS